MQEDKSRLISFAMSGGMYLGLFWLVKYLCVMGAGAVPALGSVNLFLSVGTPLILFYFLVKYRIEILDGTMRFGHGVQFSILLFFFASLLESTLVFAHVQWIDPSYIGNLYANMIEMAKTLPLDKTMVAAVENQPLPSPANYVFNNVVIADVFIGMLLSLALVPMSFRYASKPFIKSEKDEQN